MRTALLGLVLLAAAGLGLAQGAVAQGHAELAGTWKLLRFTRTDVATGEAMETFGKAPSGYLQLGRDGRMMMLVVKEGRATPPEPEKMTDEQRAELYKTMIAYGGTYTFDGKALHFHLDVTWNQAYTGTELVRQVTRDEKKLTLTAEAHKSYVDGKTISAVMEFEKVE